MQNIKLGIPKQLMSLKHNIDADLTDRRDSFGHIQDFKYNDNQSEWMYLAKKIS